MKKLVIFGAGKIGRSFIGQLFSRAGYEVVFIDKDERMIEALNRQRSFKVFICDTYRETIHVENVRGVTVEETDKVIHEIAKADILAVSIGKNGLPFIMPVLAKGLLKREQDFPGHALDIIIAENKRNADDFFRDELTQLMPPDYPFSNRVGLVETSIGKMVPLQVTQDENILNVSAEAYNTLIVSKNGFLNPIPSVKGMEPKENMKAWVDRKLFIHNLGHAAVAYIGYMYHPDYIYAWQALDDPIIKSKAKEVMLQSADVLKTVYLGEFTDLQLQEHIDDLLGRFANRFLGDTLFRVGCDLYRKLSSDDRIITPLRTAYQHQLPYNHILDVLFAALQFKCAGPDGLLFPSDVDFHKELEEKGKKQILKSICGFTEMEYNKLMPNLPSLSYTEF